MINSRSHAATIRQMAAAQRHYDELEPDEEDEEDGSEGYCKGCASKRRGCAADCPAC